MTPEIKSQGASHEADHTRDLSPAQAQIIRDELDRMLASPTFAGSKRCQEFLHFIVEQSLAGSTDRLKERTIGIEVFHRQPDYEPGSDPIVRVRATEVRKRLGQYYDQATEAMPVRIGLTPGSYFPTYQWEQVEPAAVPDAGARRKWWPWVLAAVAAVAVLAVFAVTPPRDALADFWQPTLASRKPVMICVGQAVVYQLSRRLHEQYASALPTNRVPGPYVVPLKPGAVDSSDIVPIVDQYVGAGSAQAAVKLTALFAAKGSSSQVRIGSDFSMVDIKHFPVVLEGAFSNEWTLKLSSQLPFAFDEVNGVRLVRERAEPKRTWAPRRLQENGRTNEDYALVSRIFDSESSEPLVMIAGITQYGTEAGGEFLTNANAFAAAASQMPSGWQRKNIQILLHLEVLGKSPGKPVVVAVRVW